MLRFLSSTPSLLFTRTVLVAFCGVSSVTLGVAQHFQFLRGNRMEISNSLSPQTAAWVPSGNDNTGSQELSWIWESWEFALPSQFPAPELTLFLFCIKLSLEVAHMPLKCLAFDSAFRVTFSGIALYCWDRSSERWPIMGTVSN